MEGQATSAETVTSADTSAGSSSSARVSTDKNRNYAVLAGTVTALAGFGWWYLGTREKKMEEVQE